MTYNVSSGTLSLYTTTTAAPTVWNSLPAHLRSTLICRRQFRDGLKSHLFADAYFWSSENIVECNVLTYLLTYLLIGSSWKIYQSCSGAYLWTIRQKWLNPNPGISWTIFWSKLQMYFSTIWLTSLGKPIRFSRKFCYVHLDKGFPIEFSKLSRYGLLMRT